MVSAGLQVKGDGKSEGCLSHLIQAPIDCLTPPYTCGHHSQSLGSAPCPGDQCCCCCYCCWWWWCRGGRGAGKGRKARRRWLLLVKRWSPSATSELCSL